MQEVEAMPRTRLIELHMVNNAMVKSAWCRSVSVVVAAVIVIIIITIGVAVAIGTQLLGQSQEQNQTWYRPDIS